MNPFGTSPMTRDQRESVAWDEVLIGLNQLEAANRVMLHATTTYTMLAAMDRVRDCFNKLQGARDRYNAVLSGVTA